MNKKIQSLGPCVLGHPLPPATFNPLLDKLLKNAGEEFKFPGNRDRSKDEKTKTTLI